MDLTQLGAIGEMVGGVAVLVTLVYLSTQVRQGNEQAKREAVASAAFDFPRQLCSFGMEDGNAAAIRDGLRDYDALSPLEAMRFNSLMVGLYVAFVGVSDHHKAGLIPQDEFEATEANFVRFLNEPGARTWWEQTKHIYPARGVEAVEDAVARLEVTPISAYWRFLES